MAIVAGIRFKDAGKVYYFDPGELTLCKGDYAIVETARGVECGYVSMGNRDVPDSEIIPPLKQVIRKATEADLQHVEENKVRQQEAFGVCEQKILEHQLDMKLVDVEYTFDNSKILFYFTSDGRVDFRNLVKDLASIFRTRIELRQIGVRDEAKMLGGLGICGRPFCCSQFLGDFQPVSIKMAKEQGLSLNPVKISGTCGRLMCCLKYEQNAYDDLLRNSPRLGSTVDTPDGRGVVLEQNLIAGTVKVRPERDADAAPKTYRVSELGEIGSTPAAVPAEPIEIPQTEEWAGFEGLLEEEKAVRTEKPHHDRPRNDRPQRHDRPRGERGGNNNNANNKPADRPERREKVSQEEKTERTERTDHPNREHNREGQRNDRPRGPRPPREGQRNDRPQRHDRPRYDRSKNGNRPERGPRPEGTDASASGTGESQ